MTDADGAIYYGNLETNETQYERPTAASVERIRNEKAQIRREEEEREAARLAEIKRLEYEQEQEKVRKIQEAEEREMEAREKAGIKVCLVFP